MVGLEVLQRSTFPDGEWSALFSDVEEVDLAEQIATVKAIYVSRALEVADGDFEKAARYLHLSVADFRRINAEVHQSRSVGTATSEAVPSPLIDEAVRHATRVVQEDSADFGPS